MATRVLSPDFGKSIEFFYGIGGRRIDGSPDDKRLPQATLEKLMGIWHKYD